VRELPAYVLGEGTPLALPLESTHDGTNNTRGYGGGGGGGGGGSSGGGSSGGGGGTSGAGAAARDADLRGRAVAVWVESGYRIRKQPKPGFLSTAECIAAALREAEPDDDDDDGGGVVVGGDGHGVEAAEEAAVEGAAGERAAAAVEASFDAMIDAQVGRAGLWDQMGAWVQRVLGLITRQHDR